MPPTSYGVRGVAGQVVVFVFGEPLAQHDIGVIWVLQVLRMVNIELEVGQRRVDDGHLGGWHLHPDASVAIALPLVHSGPHLSREFGGVNGERGRVDIEGHVPLVEGSSN
eukprot:CAMPEP_0170485736 /NCGR_PEP_ID=MMETSP0208-20121228/4920_1 /TAXON_ID=197538 /ORGANISM="Strombidium inclinatum, Strain S3" /LENGTH=109 /DNA_ID=CAMNT_0010759461 /DNA_START=440 /DNA_END=765 /DNA_ORIENTATION=-